MGVIGHGLVLTGGAKPKRVTADKASVASRDWSALIGTDDACDAGLVRRETVEEVHEVAASLFFIRAAPNSDGVFFKGRAMPSNLVAPMLRGDRHK